MAEEKGFEPLKHVAVLTRFRVVRLQPTRPLFQKQLLLFYRIYRIIVYMQPSVFTKIVQGEIPSHKVYEDDRVLAFMDIAPVQEGMLVLIPKDQIEHFEDLPEEISTRLIVVAQKLMKTLKHTYPDRTKIALQVEGLDVPHAHIKLVPITVASDLEAKPPQGEPDHSRLAEQAERIKENL